MIGRLLSDHATLVPIRATVWTRVAFGQKSCYLHYTYYSNWIQFMSGRSRNERKSFLLLDLIMIYRLFNSRSSSGHVKHLGRTLMLVELKPYNVHVAH